MASVTPSTSTPKARTVRRQAGSSPAVQRGRLRRDRGADPGRGPLGRYEDRYGRSREVVQRPAGFGTVLVIDRDVVTLGDCRLVAHLGSEEPQGNAELMCGEYLRALAEARGGCREVTAQDVAVLPYAEPDVADDPEGGGGAAGVVVDRGGNSYRLELIPSAMSIPVLRWRRHHVDGSAGGPTVVSVREAVAALEDYAPVCEITERALARCRTDESVSTVILGGEIERVRLSPIVLNRLLRVAVLAAVQHQGLSLSALAIRCGRMKRDHSGETSWLARRIGVLPEGGQSAPTPWIHSDVLALIARRGLGISPREVELQ
jgi:hypothetical protein